MAILIGIMAPAGCVAVAAEGRHTLAMLRRRTGETLLQLLNHLDLAVATAMVDDIFTDEVNTPNK
jgi:fumarate reductase subunit D